MVALRTAQLGISVVSAVSALRNTYNYIDFLRGDEEYKYRIGCEDRKLLTIKIKVK